MMKLEYGIYWSGHLFIYLYKSQLIPFKGYLKHIYLLHFIRCETCIIYKHMLHNTTFVNNLISYVWFLLFSQKLIISVNNIFSQVKTVIF